MITDFKEDPLSIFQGNKIYNRLKEKGSPYKFVLDNLYHACKDRLSQIPMVFPNYTYHDIGHVVRVADYMTDFVSPKINELSDLHLFMILAAGLLHDTGMFVSIKEKEDEIDKRVQSGMSLSEAEEDFQNYIRKNHASRVRNVFEVSPFKEIFADFKKGKIDKDLALICQSHTEELDWICANINDNRNFKSDRCNPQQIALLLKLGDNLDFDDRRAPSYMIDMLGIKGFSKSEWKKHVLVSNYDKVILQNDNTFILKFSGEGDNTVDFRNTLKHIRWLDKTAKTISSIASKYASEYAFEISKTEIDITANGFQYSELEFKLDYNKVLKLLMGEHIYNTRQDGLRELLQNSIDAVMVMKELASKKGLKTGCNPIIQVKMAQSENKIQIIDNGTGIMVA